MCVCVYTEGNGKWSLCIYRHEKLKEKLKCWVRALCSMWVKKEKKKSPKGDVVIESHIVYTLI